MQEFEQSVSAEYQFFMADATDYFTPETGISPTVQIRKVGGSFATVTNTPVEIANGWYYVTLTTTELNTLGGLAIRANGTGCAEWREKVLVVSYERDLRDSAITAAKFTADAIVAATLATDAITSDAIAASAVTEIQSGLATPGDQMTLQDGAITAAKLATNAITAAKIAANAITNSQLASGAITADTLAANAIGTSEFSQALIDAIVDYIWNEIIPGSHDTANSAGKILQDLTAATFPTASDNADAVWDRVLPGNHDITNSAGEFMQDAGLATSVTAIADQVLQEPIGDHDGVAGSLAEKISSLNSPVTAGQPGTQTNERLVAQRGATYTFPLTDLTFGATWNRVVFAIKTDIQMDLDDEYSMIFIQITNGGDASDGLIWINGTEPDVTQQAQASLTVNQGAGTLTIYMDEEITQLIPKGNHNYAAKEEQSGGDEIIRAQGTFVVEQFATRNALL